MNILYLSSPHCGQYSERVKYLIDSFINKVSDKFLEIDINRYRINKSKFGNVEYLRNTFKITTYILTIPFVLIIETFLILNSNERYYKITRDSITDDLERRSGYLATVNNKSHFIRRRIIKFIFKSMKITILVHGLKLLIDIFKIKGIFIPQLNGIPYSSVSALCINKDIYVGSYSMTGENLLTIFRKGKDNEKLHERYPLPADLEKMRLLTNEELDKIIFKIKSEYLARTDPICNPSLITKKFNNDNLITKLKNSSKRNVIVLLHVFTDQARFRMDKFWFDSYLDWFIETIKLCKINKEVNWIFKGHPLENKYPINNQYSDFIKRLIRDNGFLYIEAKDQFLHEDMAQIDCVVLTCHGTCKMEYPAMFSIPVISCIGSYLNYDSYNQPLTAHSFDEYKTLILNAHNVSLSNSDIRNSRELLSFFKHFSGVSIKYETQVKLNYDSNGNIVYRNF
tara:strand:+ start:2131 stop:3492 length:1362 start_codon:yes stop_codon:yes gene_type:complete